MGTIDYTALREAIASGNASVVVSPLHAEALDDIAWSGSSAHLENVARQLHRVATGGVVYLVGRADGHAVSKGGIDFEREPGTGTIWQVATHPRLEGLGLATLLIAALEQQAIDRGHHRLRLDVELDNPRARRLYEHLGYRRIGQSEASWEAEAPDGSRYHHSTTVTEMAKLV
jgi:ribosomal protein S18 acetylase RimI-like enzyme